MKTRIKKIKWKNLSKHLIPNAGTLVLVALMLFAYNVWAAPNWAANAQATSSSFSYQGTLADENGNPVTADEEMIFRLYNVSSGGSALWEEFRTGTNAVSVENGLFQVMLGGLTPIPASVWENDILYLGVKIGDDSEMSPREMIGSVPRALQAELALTVPDGSISSDQLENHLCCGFTNPNGTGWQNYNDGRGIYIEADTSTCNFSSTPMYFTSLAGANAHWVTVGSTSIYASSSTSFKI